MASPYPFYGASWTRFFAHMYDDVAALLFCVEDVHVDALWEALRVKAPSSETSTNASDVQVTDEDCFLSCCVGHERANLNQSCRQQDGVFNEHRCAYLCSLEFNLHLEFFKRGGTDEMRSLGILLLTLFHGALWLSLVRGVKEKLCYLASDYDTELNSTAGCSDNKQTHMLSDGIFFTVSTEHFRCSCVFCFFSQEASLSLRSAESTTLLSTTS